MSACIGDTLIKGILGDKLHVADFPWNLSDTLIEFTRIAILQGDIIDFLT